MYHEELPEHGYECNNRPFTSIFNLFSPSLSVIVINFYQLSFLIGSNHDFEQTILSTFLLLTDRGMTVTSGHVTLKKDPQNLIGISIGGGAPLCPCLYVVQVFDNTPAAKEGQLAAGDEIVGVNGQSVKGRTKVEVARMIQSIKVSETGKWEGV